MSRVGSEYYAKDGRELSFDEYLQLLKSERDSEKDYRRVAWTDVEIDGVTWHVSTVWLGLDHSHTFDEDQRCAPLTFETMAFRDLEPKPYRELNDWNDEEMVKLGMPADLAKRGGDMIVKTEFKDWQFRWATEERALAGHQAVVAWILKEGPEPKGDYSMTYDEWFLEVSGVSTD